MNEGGFTRSIVCLSTTWRRPKSLVNLDVLSVNCMSREDVGRFLCLAVESLRWASSLHYTLAMTSHNAVLAHALNTSGVKKLRDKRIVLASASPRRSEILRTLASLPTRPSDRWSHYTRVSHRRSCPRRSPRTCPCLRLSRSMNIPSPLRCTRRWRCTRGSWCVSHVVG